jgi:uncharacterized protein YbaR (Trm112 family)/SAM-dependent methyltransferase
MRLKNAGRAGRAAMNEQLLNILECPFCGDRLRAQRDSVLETRGDDVAHAILACPCCAYPVVDGIPFVHANGTANEVMEMLGAGRKRDALLALLGLDEPRRQRFARMLDADDEPPMTFRAALEVLSRDAEGVYLLHRFSDPSFLASQAVLETIARDPRSVAGHVLDVCGGAGHLTRTLVGRAGAARVILADIAYWKVWLAARFVAPGCLPVCCDAGNPLPFAKGAFSLACCADAFHYVWPRRLLAGEMARLVGERGAVALLNVHNALRENYSAGMPLTPAGYRRLFDGLHPRLFKQDEIQEAMLAGRTIDLSTDHSDKHVSDAHDLMLIASRLDAYPRPARVAGAMTLPHRRAINPLYRSERTGGRCVLTLAFPSDEYEQEFGGCKAYLPPRVEISASQLDGWLAGETDGQYADWAARRVILELPERYL